MDKELRKTIIFILAFTIVIIPIAWIYLGMVGIGNAGDVAAHLEQYRVLRILIFPFEVLISLGFWGGLGIAIVLLLIGCFNITKKWGKNSCLVGVWSVIFYLIGNTVTYTSIFLSAYSKLWAWFLLEVSPALIVFYLFTTNVLRKIRNIEIKSR